MIAWSHLKVGFGDVYMHASAAIYRLPVEKVAPPKLDTLASLRFRVLWSLLDNMLLIRG
jgi:hypothetical protein